MNPTRTSLVLLVALLPTWNGAAAGSAGSVSGFVSKVNPFATGAASLAWSTGSSHDTSDNFPVTADACQPAFGRGVDGVLSVLSAEPDGLRYSTFFGGTYEDRIRGVAAAADGTIFVTGLSRNLNGTMHTTPGAFHATDRGVWRMFVARFDLTGAVGRNCNGTVAAPPPPPQPDYCVAYTPTTFTIAAGQTRTDVPIRVTNCGNVTWSASQVQLGYHWYDAGGTQLVRWDDGRRTGLLDNVAPGQTVTLSGVVRAPYNLIVLFGAGAETAAPAGTYTLAWDLVEGTTWWSGRGQPTGRVTVQ